MCQSSSVTQVFVDSPIRKKMFSWNYAKTVYLSRNVEPCFVFGSLKPCSLLLSIYIIHRAISKIKPWRINLIKIIKIKLDPIGYVIIWLWYVTHIHGPCGIFDRLQCPHSQFHFQNIHWWQIELILKNYFGYPGSLLLTQINLIPAWISKHISSKVCDEITYSFPNFNGATVEVWEWVSNFIPHYTPLEKVQAKNLKTCFSQC